MQKEYHASWAQYRVKQWQLLQMILGKDHNTQITFFPKTLSQRGWDSPSNDPVFHSPKEKA